MITKYLLLINLVLAFGVAKAQTGPLPRQLGAPPDAADRRPASRNDAELAEAGWRFASIPRVMAVDDKSGTVRFRLVVNATGAPDSVTTVSSTVSAKQEARCREALWKAHFVAVGDAPGRGAGFYTFRFTVR